MLTRSAKGWLAAVALLALAALGCTHGTCVDPVVETTWDGGLSDGGTWTGGPIDALSCSLLCSNSNSVCAATDGGVRCDGYCVQ